MARGDRSRQGPERTPEERKRDRLERERKRAQRAGTPAPAEPPPAEPPPAAPSCRPPSCRPTPRRPRRRSRFPRKSPTIHRLGPTTPRPHVDPRLGRRRRVRRGGDAEVPGDAALGTGPRGGSAAGRGAYSDAARAAHAPARPSRPSRPSRPRRPSTPSTPMRRSGRSRPRPSSRRQRDGRPRLRRRHRPRPRRPRARCESQRLLSPRHRSRSPPRAARADPLGRLSLDRGAPGERLPGAVARAQARPVAITAARRSHAWVPLPR